MFDDECLFCVLLSVPFSLRVVLGKSKSKLYNAARAILNSIPYCQDNDILSITDVTYLCEYTETINKLVLVAGTWKSFSVTLNNKEISSSVLFDLMHHLNRILDVEQSRSIHISETGQLILLKGERVKYAEGDCVVQPCQFKENLPFPYVCYPSHYGAFIGFREREDSEVILCECAKEAVAYFLHVYNNDNDISKNFPTPIVKKLIAANAKKYDLRDCLSFKSNLCHVCNQMPPKLRWCIPMYGSESDMLFGWYFKQERYKYGEVKTAHNIKDDVRFRAGYIRWITETKIYKIVKSLYPNCDIETHACPDFLDGMEYDIFIPSLNLAIEYQGIQHFEPVDFFGGIDSFEKVKERDAKKLKLSKENEIKLIYFDYTEEISEALIKSKLEKYQFEK